MILSYLIGGHDSEYALGSMNDLRGRLRHRVQMTTHGHRAYAKAASSPKSRGPYKNVGFSQSSRQCLECSLSMS